MIVFDLKCAANGHIFEAWFGSSADYEHQQERGLVCCPICGGAEVGKAPMAAAVPKKGGAGAPAGEAVATGEAEHMKALLAAAAMLQKKVLEKSEHVGDRFAEEARAIHLGESEARAIHGRATRDQAQSLMEDGIPVAPLPFPVPERGEEN